jgi:hypothetical protein
MSRTYKDQRKKDNYDSRMRISKKVKREAKQKRKRLKDETNPQALKRQSADRWNYD